jgi:hypothetical protein
VSYMDSAGAPDPVASTRKSGRGVLVAGVVLVLAALLLAAAFYFLDGMSYLTKLTSPTPKKPANSTAAASTTTTAAADQTEAEFARRMYVEQIESEAVMKRLADGEVEALVVKHVRTDEESATLDVIATFRDGTYADGSMVLVKRDGTWYMFSLTGLRKNPDNGFSSSVAGFKDIEASQTVEEAAAREGISTFDQGVIDTLMSEQPKQQEFVSAILDGTYNALNFGKPKRGAGVITTPVTLTGPETKSAKGSMVLIRKTIDGQPRTFLLSLSH